MANSEFFQEGKFDPAAFRTALEEKALRTETVHDPGLPEPVEAALKDPYSRGEYEYNDEFKSTKIDPADYGFDELGMGTLGTPSAGLKLGILPGTAQALGESILSQYESQREVLQGQATTAADALRMYGAGFEEFMAGTEAQGEEAAEDKKAAQERFDLAAAAADQAVKDSKTRAQEVMRKLEEINLKAGEQMDFARAHDVQIGVQSTIGRMKDEERGIVGEFGAGSPEHRQFKAAQSEQLGIMNSGIQSTYAKLRDEQHQTYLKTSSEAMLQSNMYINFQEQLRVETLKGLAQANAAYDLEYSQFQIGLEQLRLRGMEDMANWMIQTPEFAMDITPITTAMYELAELTIPRITGEDLPSFIMG
jgi:hypothetical protein